MSEKQNSVNGKIENNSDKNSGNMLWEEQTKYLSEVSKRPFFRVAAWIGLAIIAALIVLTVITGITGSKYFMPCLILCMIVPVLLYVILWMGKVLFSANRRKNPDSDTERND